MKTQLFLGLLLICVLVSPTVAMDKHFPQSGNTRVIGAVTMVDMGWEIRENDFEAGTISCKNIISIENPETEREILFFQYIPKGALAIEAHFNGKKIEPVLSETTLEATLNIPSDNKSFIEIIGEYGGIKLEKIEEEGDFVGPTGVPSNRYNYTFTNTSEYYVIKSEYTLNEGLVDTGGQEIKLDLEPMEQKSYAVYITQKEGQTKGKSLVVLAGFIFVGIILVALYFKKGRKL